MKKLLFSAMIASSLFACKSETKPAFDLANAKKEIEAADQEVINFILSGDSVGAANAYSKEGTLMADNMPALAGVDKISAFWGGFSKIAGGLTLTTLEVWGDENFITEEGVFEVKGKDGNQLDKGKYLVLWKKEDGKWKLHRDLSNSDLPLVTK
jgi:ketosteroid isomerase-like protein